ncbi:MAG TPA: cytochrome D1 domain-containing protein [Mucilaginibacter sp.]|jgi:YVTN family beta-propeller protein
MDNTANNRLFAIINCKTSSINLFITSLVLAIFFCGINSCIAQSSPKSYLLALSKADHTLAIVDPSTLKVIAKVPVGTDPHEVIASADGKTAYVSIYGGGSLHEIDVIDLVAQKALPAVDTKPFFGPHGLTFAAGKLWFTAEGSKAVASYDPATSAFDWAMGTGQDRTHMIYVTPNAKKIYTTNVSSGTVSILADTLIQPGNFGPPPGATPPPGGGPPPGVRPQPRHDWVQTVIPVSRGSEGFDVSPDGKQLWTAASDDGTIAVIDLATKKVIEKIDAKVQGANRLAFTPDGKLVLISSLRNGELTVYDAASHKEVKKVNIGHGAAGILMDPNGSRAFIGCTADNYVAIVDLKTLRVIGHIDVGRGPDGLAWAVR